MKVIKATQQMLETRTLVLGFQGENLRTQLRIDCSPTFAEYPNATPALAVKPSSGETYPVFVERDGNEVVWDIVANNLVLKGDGELQLTFYKDNVIAKTVIGTIRVNRSLQIDGEMPDVVATWIENANRKLAEVDAQIVELEGMVDTATDAAERAEQSASTAGTAADQAAGSAATATAKATEATNAAGTATAKAAEAQLQAQYAINSAQSAAESERIATAKAGEATTAAGTATAKAEQATEAAETATEKAGDASASATAAHASEINAAESADDALSAEVGANAAKTAAEGSATQAGASAQNAGIAAQTATQKATEATQSATNAGIFAGTATTKAEEAAESAQTAQDAQTAVEQTAEQLADSLEQIDQNTQDIAELDERKANVDGYYPDMTVGNAEQLNSSKYVENSEPYTLRPSGGTSDIGNREYLDAVVGGTLAWNQMVRDEASENSTDFADVVTVTDAVEDAAEVRVKLDPVQDLHGYDHPWPAGGGKNLLNLSGYDTAANYTINSDGTITVNSNDGSAWDGRPTIPLKAGTYTVSYSATSGNLRYKLSEDDYTEEFMTAVSKTFTLTADGGIKFKFGLGASAYPITVKVQLESGSTATDWTPYSNICPITGWDGVKVTRTGKNLLNNNLATTTISGVTFTVNDDGTVSTTGTASSSSAAVFRIWRTIDVTSDIILSGCPTGGNYSFGYSIMCCDYSGQAVVNSGGIDIGSGATFPAEAIPKIRQIQIIIRPGVNANGLVFKPMIRLASISDATYEPYSGNTYSITLPTEAGTVYGGELTVNADGSGSLVVDRAEVDAGSLNWSVTNTHCFYSQAIQATKEPNLPSDIPNLICSAYRTDSPSRTYHGDIGDCVSVGKYAIVGAKRIIVYSSSNTDPTTFKASMSGVQLVYELATPITYTLTASQIRTLLGQNNIWADTGDLALTYTGTDEHLTLESGKKYLARLNGTDSMLLGSGQEITAAKGTDNVFDLTQMFGTAVADYVYGQGASFFRKWFPNAVYPYNAGELKHVEGLQSHDMVGFNQWDEEVRHGYYNEQTGAFVESSAYCANKNPIPAFPNTVYYGTEGSTYVDTFLCYDSRMNYLGTAIRNADNTRTTRPNTAFINFRTRQAYGGTYKHDICINLAHNGSRNGEYEPYEKHSYPLDSTVVLRGIPKVGANGVYWDGDRYLPDGTVERRYKEILIDESHRWYKDTDQQGYSRYYFEDDTIKRYLGYSGLIPNSKGYENANGYAFANATNDVAVSLYNIGGGTNAGKNWFYIGFKPSMGISTVDALKTWLASNNFTIVVELATPTTETAQPYHSTQWVSDWGTEEFVSTGIVPVGHETRYPANLRDKLQHLPDAASGNGSYLITQTDGQMVLTPFPAPPSTAGNYVLKATVTGGVATYTWEVAT